MESGIILKFMGGSKPKNTYMINILQSFTYNIEVQITILIEYRIQPRKVHKAQNDYLNFESSVQN